MMGRVLRRFKAPFKGLRVRVRIGAFMHKPTAMRTVVEPGSILSLVLGVAARRASDPTSVPSAHNSILSPKMPFLAALVPSSQPLALFQQDGSWPQFTLLASQAMTVGSLSLSLSELLLSY